MLSSSLAVLDGIDPRLSSEEMASPNESHVAQAESVSLQCSQSNFHTSHLIGLTQ